MSAHFDWLSSSHAVQLIFTYLYKAIVIVVGVITLYFSYKANRFFYEKLKGRFFVRQESSSKKEWLLLYVFGALLGVFISSILSPIIFSYWHLIIIFPFAIMPFLLYFQPYSQKYLKKFVLFTLSYFLLINIMGAVDSRKYSINTDYVKDTQAYIQKEVINAQE